MLIYIVLAVAPGLFLLWFFYRRDRWEREPPGLVLATYAAGAFSVLPVLAVSTVAGFTLGIVGGAAGVAGWTLDTAGTVVLAPLVEEPAKLLAVLLVAYRRPAFNEPMDGIVYGCAAALGFATVENVMYVLGALGQGAGHAQLVLVMRALLAVPGHALFAIPWALALGLAKFEADRGAGRQAVLRGLALGMAFHAAHNLLAVLSPYIGATFLFVLALWLWSFANGRIRLALARSPFAPQGSDADRTG